MIDKYQKYHIELLLFIHSHVIRYYYIYQLSEKKSNRICDFMNNIQNKNVFIFHYEKKKQ